MLKRSEGAAPYSLTLSDEDDSDAHGASWLNSSYRFYPASVSADSVVCIPGGSDALAAEAVAASASGLFGAVAPASSSAAQPIYNGSGGTTVAVAASGDQRIDGVLRGVRWNGGSITYSDPDAAGDYTGGYHSDGDGDSISAQNEGFSRLNAGEHVALDFSLNADIFTQPAGSAGFSAEGMTDLTISYAGARVRRRHHPRCNSSDPSTSYAFYPNNSIYGGRCLDRPVGAQRDRRQLQLVHDDPRARPCAGSEARA